ncbi:MAG: formylmethanofuran dehydrogenase subunit C [Piscinibacter sp.]|uniref:formylmethanofuran dehydrogenase subunit C n=1 Tax=Piscinibacter sp. TaxID=1903157 RepID=UPI003D12CD13
MSGFTLTLKAEPALRLDLRGITPAALAAMDAAAVAKQPVGHGNGLVPLAEFFAVAPRSDDTLVLQGELSRCDFIGWQMDGGTLIAEGSVGDYAGGAMKAGMLTVKGSAADLAACEMAGGTLTIEGHVGAFAASTLPGSMDGMRGGTLVVRGNAGARFGDRMRRGTALIFGDAGDFLASRMVAGTIALAGRAGAHVGYGMRRGSLVFAGAEPTVSATFVPAVAGAPVFWQLLSRDLARHGGAFGSLATRGIDRHLGDVAAGGKGELIVVR